MRPTTVPFSWSGFAHGVAATFLCLLASVDAQAISSRRVLQAASSTVTLGPSVAGVGDLNGDGFDDVAVGVNINVGADPGRVYIYFGGENADAVADLTLTGAVNGDGFGTSVAGVGDVNGDGRPDVLVGAPRNDAGGADAGRAYLYFGGPSMDTTPDFTLTGTAAGDQFGFAVAGARDVNGDGYADLLVGAPFSDVSGADAGRACLYFGGASLDAIIDLDLQGGQANEQFGTAVAGAGDMNGDGYADIAVGAPRHDAGAADMGRAVVYLGSVTPNITVDLQLVGTFNLEILGSALAGAGDVNGDGFHDLIVGAYSLQATTGRANVLYGSAVLNNTVDLSLAGFVTLDNFGFGVAGADVNGDGYSDLVVSAPRADFAGHVYVYLGGTAADANADLHFLPSTGSRFGGGIAAAGDVDGDGRDDFVVGFSQTSRMEVISCYPFQVTSPAATDRWVVGSSATVRWRGHDPADLAISLDGGLTWTTRAAQIGGEEVNSFTLTVPAGETNAAKVRLTYTGQVASRSTSGESRGVFAIGPAVTPPMAANRVQRSFNGQAAYDYFGQTVADAGDVNGDGYHDAIVGAPYNSAGGPMAGRAYVYFGGPTGDATADLTLTGEAAGDYFGSAVGGGVDVNGDGFDDILVGASQSDAGGANAGRAYVYYGGALPNATADLVLTGSPVQNYFGYSVAGAGDVDGDGFDDFYVGRAYDGGTQPCVFLYRGGGPPDALPDLIYTSGVNDDYFGYLVASAGDLNGDGFADLAVGASGSDVNGADAGRAYVFLGGRVPDAVADLVLTGEAAGDQFGVSIAGVGDFDADGFDDLLIGAPYSDVGGVNSGRAALYRGSSLLDANADLYMTGSAAGDLLGIAVAAAGDVNGDHHADLVIGSPGADAGGLDRGRTLVCYGGPGADGVPDVVVQGEADNIVFGNSVASAGDANGDGFDDVLVGAPGYGIGPAEATGRVSLVDFNRYFLLAPNGGETWNVGATRTLTWQGAEPADVWLSVDGGHTYQNIRSGVGGNASNAMPLLVPHAPTRFARVRITPTNTAIDGQDESDALFTIQSSIALLNFTASLEAGGAELRWSTDPGVGTAGLAGYRLYRSTTDGPGIAIGPALIAEARYLDPEGTPGARYRLIGVNGLMEELELGRVTLRPAVPLAASPLPYRSGSMAVTFAVYGLLGGAKGEANVELIDLLGRRIATIANGAFGAGYQTVAWDGRDDQGSPLPSGLYFLRARTAGLEHRLKVVVVR